MIIVHCSLIKCSFLPWGMAIAAESMLFVIVNEIIPEIDRESIAQEGTSGIMTSDPLKGEAACNARSRDWFCCHDVSRYCFRLVEYSMFNYLNLNSTKEN